MQKANQWLLDNGFIKEITRGRRSRENQIRLHEAYLSGVRFSDWEPKEGTDSKGDYATTNAKPVTNGSTEIQDITIRFPTDEFQGTATVNGKEIDVSLAEICQSCLELAKREAGTLLTVSLSGHYCETPTVTTAKGALGRVTPVIIEPRTRKRSPYPWS